MPENISETTPTIGRPAHEPSEQDRRTVTAMASFGMPQPAIAKFLRISPTTLRKHFRQELDRAAVEANLQVLGSLFTMATTRHNVAAAIFWAKTRCGYRPGGAPYDSAVSQKPPKPSPAQAAQNCEHLNFIVYNNDGEPNAPC